MKCAMSILGWSAVILALGTPVIADADEVSLTPAQAIVLPDDHSGISRVALLFDLSSLREGEGRIVDEALIDWTVSGVPSENPSSYSVYPITSFWTGASTSISVTEDPTETWEIEPEEFARNGGLIRFTVTELVSGWASGKSNNYGVVMTTEDVSREALSAQIMNARLVVRYGFTNY